MLTKPTWWWARRANQLTELASQLTELASQLTPPTNQLTELASQLTPPASQLVAAARPFRRTAKGAPLPAHRSLRPPEERTVGAGVHFSSNLVSLRRTETGFPPASWTVARTGLRLADPRVDVGTRRFVSEGFAPWRFLKGPDYWYSQ